MVGSIFYLQHWIRLDMYSDVTVKSLKMSVDPSDNSYMPSVVVVSGGCSVSSLTELNVVNVRNTDTSVALLSNLDHHYPIIEIAIVKCRNGGRDCKIHGLTIAGVKKVGYGELKTSVSFLANDWDLIHEPGTGAPFVGKCIS